MCCLLKTADWQDNLIILLKIKRMIYGYAINVMMDSTGTQVFKPALNVQQVSLIVSRVAIMVIVLIVEQNFNLALMDNAMMELKDVLSII